MAHAWGVLYQAHLTLKVRTSFPVPFPLSTTGLARRCWHLEIDLIRHYCRSWQKGELRGVGALGLHQDMQWGGGAETTGKPQPLIPAGTLQREPASHPASSSRSPRLPANKGLQTHCSKAGQDFIRNKQGDHGRALSTLSSGLGNTCHRPGVQSHTIKPEAAFLFFQPKEGEESHPWALTRTP